MNDDRSHGPTDAADRPRPSSEALFHEVRVAAARVAALRAPSAALSHDVLHSAFEELECAHEELRVAEDHVHLQADALAQAHVALERERKKYRELFEAAPDSYVLTDLSGHILEANRRAAALFNIESSFMSGKPLAVFVGHNDRAHFRNTLALLREADHATFGLRLLPRGTVGEVQATASVSRARGPDGNPPELRWLFRDFGPGKDVQDRLQDRIAVLEREASETAHELEALKSLLDHCLLREEATKRHTALIMREQHRLLATIAHELLSPLSSVGGWLQIAASRKAVSAVKERAFSSMTRSLRALTRTAEDLKDYARAAEGVLNLELAEIGLAELLSQVRDDCAPTARVKEVQLRVEPPERTSIVRVDARRLRRALGYLVEDALKAAPTGGEVRIAASASPEHIDVQVIDSEASERAVKAPGTEGAAHPLGLQVARRLVELHGGSLSVERPQKGLTARVTVRLALVSVSAASQ